MSNCLQIPDIEIKIDAEHLVDDSLKDVKDTDGNFIGEVGNELLFIPSRFTTWRELANFVRLNIAPFVVEGTRVSISGVRDESDGFENEFELTIDLSAKEYDKVFK